VGFGRVKRIKAVRRPKNVQRVTSKKRKQKVKRENVGADCLSVCVCAFHIVGKDWVRVVELLALPLLLHRRCDERRCGFVFIAARWNQGPMSRP
jgi:hypothetical protein